MERGLDMHADNEGSGSSELWPPYSTKYFSRHGRVDDTSATSRSWMISWQFEHSKILRPSSERAIGCAQLGQSGHMIFPCCAHQVWLETTVPPSTSQKRD